MVKPGTPGLNVTPAVRAAKSRRFLRSAMNSEARKHDELTKDVNARAAPLRVPNDHAHRLGRHAPARRPPHDDHRTTTTTRLPAQTRAPNRHASEPAHSLGAVTARATRARRAPGACQHIARAGPRGPYQLTARATETPVRHRRRTRRRARSGRPSRSPFPPGPRPARCSTFGAQVNLAD